MITAKSQVFPTGRTRILHPLLLTAASLFAAAIVNASNPNFRMGFPTVVNVPGPNFQNPPIIDGNVSGDLGWTAAFRYVFGNGTPAPDVIVQAIKDNDFIYLSFEVANDISFDNDDMIVVTLDPTGNAADAHRIHIYPIFDGVGAGAGGAPREVDHWVNSSTWNQGGAMSPLPPNGDIKVSSAGTPSTPGHIHNVSWVVEMKLKRSDYNIPPAADFGIYFDVIRILTDPGPPQSSTAVEKFWPTTCPEIGLDVNGNTPAPGTWGTASLSGTGNGVSIAPADIFTDQTPPTKIAFPPGQNVFNVNVHNNSVDASAVGNPPIQAKAVTAHFRIANFGLPGPVDWAAVPTGNNPTPATDLAPSSVTELSTSPWLLTAAQVVQYTANPHQCILVELDSTAPNTVFANKSAWLNMNFGPASKFRSVAKVSAHGYGAPPAGMSKQRFDLHVQEQELYPQRLPANIAAIRGAKTNTQSQYLWLAHGYRRTGRFILIHEKKFPIVDHAGSFGYIVQHDGSAPKWAATLVGKGLERRAVGLYSLNVAPEGVAALTTTVTAAATPARHVCGTTGAGGASAAAGGMALLGLVAYRPRKKR